MPAPLNLNKFTYAGLFTTTLATLMLENLLTRIFSVTMLYHYAFMAVSIAMFGMTLGAIIVYLFPAQFKQEHVGRHLVTTALLFSATIIVTFLVHINIPMTREITGTYLPLTFILVSIPFVFAGINTCLMLTKIPGHIGRLYAADLAGAALGCIFFIYTLDITDGPTAIFITALIAMLGAYFYTINNDHPTLKRVIKSVGVLLFLFVTVQATLAHNQKSLIRIKWIKGGLEPAPILEKWNSFSRVRIWGDPTTPIKPFGWGISKTYPEDKTTRYLTIDIDSNAETPLAAFDGDFEKVDYLKYDITNLAHYLRPNADVLVVGTGGGRDILSALAFQQNSITGVEINENIIEILTNEFGEYSGHLDQYPNVKIVNDEARSYIARSKDEYDIIQVSLIDTWAATASGAYILTENSLYTVEAWNECFDHLKPNGVLTFSRWYFKDLPGEMYRVTALASKALKEQGVENPRNHILIVRSFLRYQGGNLPDGVGTILISKKPFSPEDTAKIEAVANQMAFDLVLTPEHSIDQTFEQITSGADSDSFIDKFPLDISAPTDNNPFFFQMLRLSDIIRNKSYSQGVMTFNITAVYTLGILLLSVFLLNLIFIITPLVLTSKRLKSSTTKNAIPLSLYFACIGIGFMMIEISQLQRLTVFLGHPTYSLSVVLFSLLLSSGMGSYATQKIESHLKSSISIRLVILLLVIGLFGFLTPSMVKTFSGAITPIRILLAMLTLFPMGFFMGMAFPMGMKIATAQAETLAPWFWGINGAMSVFASVLTIAVSINSGISSSFWLGFGCYLTAFTATLWIKTID